MLTIALKIAYDNRDKQYTVGKLMTQKSTILSIITAMCLVACGVQDDSTTRKRKATSASDTVMYSLDDTVIELPCKHVQLSPHNHREPSSSELLILRSVFCFLK